MMESVIWWVGFVVFAAASTVTLMSGTFRCKGGTVTTRSREPFSYWLWTGVELAATVALFLGAVAYTFSR